MEGHIYNLVQLKFTRRSSIAIILQHPNVLMFNGVNSVKDINKAVLSVSDWKLPIFSRLKCKYERQSALFLARNVRTKVTIHINVDVTV